MYRHGFNYMCGFSPDWKRFDRIPRHPYYDKCSKQEGVKAGRPTPYIGAPSDVNFKKSAPDYSVIGSAFFMSRPSSFARRASPSGVIPPVLFLGIPVGLFLTS